MPLKKGNSPKIFGANIKAELNAGKKQSQAVAIAYSMKNKSSKSKGK